MGSFFYILYSLFYILYSIFFILYSVFFILYSLFHILYCIFYILYSILYISVPWVQRLGKSSWNIGTELSEILAVGVGIYVSYHVASL